MMRICTCENGNCRYVFRYPLLPPSCPDCGKRTVRPANKAEITRYLREQKILREEITSGLLERG